MVDIKRIDKITQRNRDAAAPVYTDFYNNFNKHPDNDQLMLYRNENSVVRSMRNLILTNKGERLGKPNLGSGINKLLFEDISEYTADLLRDKIVDTIEKYEPRVKIITVDIIPNELQHSYEVTLLFEIINKTQPQQITINLYRVR